MIPGSEMKKQKQPTKKAEQKKKENNEKMGQPLPPTAQQIPNKDAVWSVVHYYRQKSSSWEMTQRDARDERKYRSHSVLIFAHHHPFGEACDPVCKEYTTEDGKGC